MYKLFLLFLLPTISFAQSGDKEFKLKGELKLNKPVDWVYLRYNSGDNSVSDSLKAKNGDFKFEGTITEPTVATLIVKFEKGSSENVAQRDFMPILLEPGKIELEAKDSLKNHTVTGTPGQTDFAKLTQQEQSYDSRLNPLYDAYSNAKKSGDKQAMNKAEADVDAIDNEMRENVYGAYVKKNPSSPIALYAIRQYAGYEIDPNKVEPLFNTLPASVQQLPSAISFKKQLDIAKTTAIGRYAMDFTQNDTLDHPVSLSSFKGKYVLVDFWASWCGPCRAENPNVVNTFNKYKDKNFTILSVSLDRPGEKARWLKAIHDDQLTWNHVSDLQYWNNAVAKQYGIQAIPQNLLLDPEGKIIAKNLRGDELEQKLGEVFAK
jgi:peroxiredoxin